MRSRRSRFETACRIGAFALIGWLFGTSLMPSGGRRVERSALDDPQAQLADWSRRGREVALHASVDAAPSPWVVDWLSALRRTGRSVTWTGSPPALALSVEALADPRGGWRIELAGPRGSSIALRDGASPIDSLRIGALGGAVTAPVLVGDLVATAGRQSASALASDATSLKPILIIGDASWEAKFIAAALEERGWSIATRFSVAPGVFVAPSSPIVLDTSRIAAVIAVDSSIQTLGPSVARFVQSGGGLVLAGSASRAAIASELAPGSLGPRWRPATLPRDTIGRGSTGFYPVSGLKADAIALERRTGGVAVAARRVGAGRVIQVGYDDSWRWRMAGAEGSENAHRDWWAGIAAAVGYAPSATNAIRNDKRSAPVAYLVDRLGPAREPPAVARRADIIDRRIFLVLILVLVLAEWTSRRLRGLK